MGPEPDWGRACTLLVDLWLVLLVLVLKSESNVGSVMACPVCVTFGGSGVDFFFFSPWKILWKLWKGKWRSSKWNLEWKVKVQLVQAAVHQSLRIKPESYSATSRESWVVWIRKFKSNAALNKWSPELQAQILPTYLKPLAEQTATWTTIERTPTARFHPKGISSSTHFHSTSQIKTSWRRSTSTEV